MAPTANTTRQRRNPGSTRAPADTDSDAEYQAYNGRLKEASAARTRLRKVHYRHTLPVSHFPPMSNSQLTTANTLGQANPRQEPHRPRHSLRVHPQEHRVPHPKVSRQAQGLAVSLTTITSLSHFPPSPPLPSPPPLTPCPRPCSPSPIPHPSLTHPSPTPTQPNPTLT